jgi:hypothetical protein
VTLKINQQTANITPNQLKKAIIKHKKGLITEVLTAVVMKRSIFWDITA